MSDGELVRQTLAGRPAAYEELVRRWSARILAFCHAKVRSRHAAEDLAQEALLRGYRALGTLDDPEKFGPWLRGIALRVCLDWLKSKQNHQFAFSDLGDGWSCDHGPLDSEGERRGAAERGAAERGERLERLLDEVEALPDEYREVVMLYYYDDVTYQELAETLGVSAATINARLTKARAMLRERMSRLAR
ncbi:MAG TPA: RNA polymerase sigma factor [Pirellulales bacterium]|nr:RNA polymerase sigma factor [Pirellulales bacterium]